MWSYIGVFVAGLIVGLALGWRWMWYSIQLLVKEGRAVIKDRKIVPVEKATEKCQRQACQHPYDSMGDKL